MQALQRDDRPIAAPPRAQVPTGAGSDSSTWACLHERLPTPRRARAWVGLAGLLALVLTVVCAPAAAQPTAAFPVTGARADSAPSTPPSATHSETVRVTRPAASERAAAPLPASPAPSPSAAGAPAAALPRNAQPAASLPPSLPPSRDPSSRPLPLGFRPLRLPYSPGDPVPDGYRVRFQPATGVLATGTVMWGASYLALILAGGGEPSAGYRFVPVIGPLLMMTGRKLECKRFDDPLLAARLGNDCAERVVAESKTVAWLLADGLVQVAGASVALVGLWTGEHQLVEDTTALRASVGPRNVNLALHGRF